MPGTFAFSGSRRTRPRGPAAFKKVPAQVPAPNREAMESHFTLRFWRTQEDSNLQPPAP